MACTECFAGSGKLAGHRGQHKRTQTPKKRKREVKASGASQETFVIEKLEDMKTKGGKRQFLVRWRGYKEPTWEPEANLSEQCPLLIADFVTYGRGASTASSAPAQPTVDEWRVDHDWVGERIVREFSSKVAGGRGYSMQTFIGEVTKWRDVGANTKEEPAMWHVVHQDGDCEDLTEEEMQKALASYQSLPTAQKATNKRRAVNTTQTAQPAKAATTKQPMQPQRTEVQPQPQRARTVAEVPGGEAAGCEAPGCLYQYSCKAPYAVLPVHSEQGEIAALKDRSTWWANMAVRDAHGRRIVITIYVERTDGEERYHHIPDEPRVPPFTTSHHVMSTADIARYLSDFETKDSSSASKVDNQTMAV